MRETSIIADSVRESGRDYFVRFRHRSVPGAVAEVLVCACDLDGGEVGVMASPSWIIYDNPALPMDADSWRAVPADDDRWCLPATYESVGQADQAAKEIAESLMHGDETVLGPLGEDVLAELFAWDGQEFDPA
jgi:hypothetical protein